MVLRSPATSVMFKVAAVILGNLQQMAAVLQLHCQDGEAGAAPAEAVCGRLQLSVQRPQSCPARPAEYNKS